MGKHKKLREILKEIRRGLVAFDWYLAMQGRKGLPKWLRKCLTKGGK